MTPDPSRRSGDVAPAIGSDASVPSVSDRTAIDRGELYDVHQTERLGPYLSEVRERWPYIWYVSASELRNRQVTTVLGNLWHLLNPALTIAVYYVIFGLLLKVDRGVDNFILFLAAGLFVFQSSQRAITAGASAIVKNVGLIKAIRFPRALLPVTTTLTELLASISTFGVIFVVALLTGQMPRVEWLLFVPLMAIQAVFNLGASLVAARLTTHFRDTTQILPFIFRLLLYGSGVIFNVAAYAEGNRTIELVFALNPFYGFVTMSRWAVMGDENLSAEMMLGTFTITVVLLVVGFFYFRADEENYARD